MLVYLLINEKATTYLDKWRLFASKQECLAAARKLGYGSSPFGEFGSLSDEPGKITQEMGCNRLAWVSPWFLSY